MAGSSSTVRRTTVSLKVHGRLAEKYHEALEFRCSIPVSRHWFAVLCNEEQKLMNEAKKGQFLTLGQTTRAGIDTWRKLRTSSEFACPRSGYSSLHERVLAAMQGYGQAPLGRRQGARPGMQSSPFDPPSFHLASKRFPLRLRSGTRLLARRTPLRSGFHAFDRSEGLD